MVSLKKRIWGWYFFDFASQPYHTVLNTFIFGPFFAAIATAYFMTQGLGEDAADAKAQSTWAVATALYGVFIAFTAPVFGAMADGAGRKRPWILFFSLMYVIGSSLLWFTQPDASNLYLMLVVFGIGFIGGEYALIFTNSQLPDLGTKEEISKISGSGFAFGYMGGVISLIIVLAFVVEQGDGKTIIGLDPIFGLDPAEREGTRATGPITALWFALFMVPYFLWVRETPSALSRVRPKVGEALRSVLSSIKGLIHRKSLGLFLLGSMFYRDGLNGLYSFGGVYATLVLNWSVPQIGAFGVVAAIGAAFFSWLGGFADRRFGPKPVVMFAIVVLMLVSFTVINLTPDTVFGIATGTGLPDNIFMACGVFIGGFGGILQAASRSLMVRHCDPESSTEYFGLYGMSGRATAFLAPTLILIVTTATGSAQIGISPVIALLFAGLVLLLWVSPEGEDQ